MNYFLAHFGRRCNIISTLEHSQYIYHNSLLYRKITTGLA